MGPIGRVEVSDLNCDLIVVDISYKPTIQDKNNQIKKPIQIIDGNMINMNQILIFNHS